MFLTHLRRLANNQQFTVLKNVFPPALAQQHWMQLLNSVYHEEGWKNSPHDYQSWRRSFPPDAYSMWYAIDRETQKVVGCSSMATYKPFRLRQETKTKLLPLSMFGMFYVMRQYQGLGIGRKIFRATMDECKERNNIFLYGLKDSWERYERGDPAFVKKPEWKLLAMNAKPGDIQNERLNVLLLKKVPSSLEVIDWKKVPWNQLAQYDAKLSMGYDREEYLRQSFEQPDSHTLVVVSSKKKTVHGLGRIRRCIDDHLVIGPLYADEPLIAKMLLRALLQPNLFPAPPKSIHYRLPDSNLEAVDMFQELAEGKVELEILHPQFTKEVIKFPTEFIYCVSEADNALY